MTKEQITSSRNNSGPQKNEEWSSVSLPRHQTNIEVLEASRDTVMARYGISQPVEGVVVVALGEKRPFAFIRELMKVVNSYGDRPAVPEKTLVEWATDERFLQKGPKDLVISVEGIVPSSIGLSRAEAVRDGMANVGVAHLAVAHFAYAAATRGDDLLRGYYVMAADGVLHRHPLGLVEYTGIHANGRHDCVAACRSWSPSR